MEKGYNKTIIACLVGCIVQAIVVNFAPLLFLTFQKSYGIPLSRITLLVTVNFAVQLTVDLLSVGIIDKLGYRASMVLAHVCAALGLVLLTVLPALLPSPFLGMLISVIIYAVGGGILEVLVSPVVEACPTSNKGKMMSMLHSFYCWGCVLVVLLSTLFFYTVGIENWKLLAILWAVLPIVNGLVFLKVPIPSLDGEGDSGKRVSSLLKNKWFWILFVMMLCAGASEQAVSQWASALAEKSFGIPKAVGDLAGPMAFAVLMGTARAIYGKYGDKISIDRFMTVSCVLAVASYLGIALLPIPQLGLLSCAVCGFAVGIMWPGTLSRASLVLPGSGTALFAFLALGGDIGCTLGPSVVGFVSGLCGDDLTRGVLAAVGFPILLLVGLRICRKESK